MIFGEKDLVESMRDTIVSMESQLVALYDEKLNHADTAELNEMIRSLEEQLHSFYSEREGGNNTDDPLSESIKSLEEQVICLTNEKMDLENKISDLEKEHDSMHVRTRSLGAALFEAAVFGGKKSL